MKKRRVTIFLHDTETAWTECYEEGKDFKASDLALDLWALDLVKRFNDTRRPSERERFIDKVTVEEESAMNMKKGIEFIEELVDRISQEEDDDLALDLFQEMEDRAGVAKDARQEDIDNRDGEEDEEDDVDDVETEDDVEK